MANLKRVLVCGATGKQGGALISALTTSQPTPPFHLVALTRNASSPKSLALAKHPNITLLEGDLNDTPAIFRKSPQPFYSVFSVQVPLKPAVEEAQGKSLIDAAITNGVKHFIYTSADRGGPTKSDADPTAIKHFASKFNIEQHLKASAAKTPGMKWTIIRPVAFMDNLTPDFLGKAFMTMWQLNGMDAKLQLVPSSAIGVLAADALKNPDKYSGQALSLATDELTPSEANEVFERVVGGKIPTTFSVNGRLIKFILREQLGVMFDWFKSDGFGARPDEFKGLGEMSGFEEWLRKESGWKGKVRAG